LIWAGSRKENSPHPLTHRCRESVATKVKISQIHGIYVVVFVACHVKPPSCEKRGGYFQSLPQARKRVHIHIQISSLGEMRFTLWCSMKHWRRDFEGRGKGC
jgi:hypothetical protein